MNKQNLMLAKMSSLVNNVRKKGRITLPEGAFLMGVSFKYYRYDIMPFVPSFYDDIRREGTDLISINFSEQATAPEQAVQAVQGGP